MTFCCTVLMNGFSKNMTLESAVFASSSTALCHVCVRMICHCYKSCRDLGVPVPFRCVQGFVYYCERGYLFYTLMHDWDYLNTWIPEALCAWLENTVSVLLQVALWMRYRDSCSVASEMHSEQGRAHSSDMQPVICHSHSHHHDNRHYMSFMWMCPINHQSSFTTSRCCFRFVANVKRSQWAKG